MPDLIQDTRSNQDIAQRKKRVSRVSIIAIGTMIVMKFIAAIVTGSVGIRADAIHSIIDLVGAVIGFVAIWYAQKPSDEDHTYGHGKAENIAGLVIAGIIFLAAGTIIYEAVHRLITGATVEMVTVGIIVTSCAIIINATISWYALKTARLTESIALEATARDMLADVFSSIAVLAGLILVGITGITILDSVIALLVGLLIVRTAFTTMKKSLSGLLDASLPAEEQDTIKRCVAGYEEKYLEMHNLRTRRSGTERFIDFHLVVPHKIDIREAHELCDLIQADIEETLLNSSVTIHIEPCNVDCDSCLMACNFS